MLTKTTISAIRVLMCALHQAAAELHRAVVGVLSKWRGADLVTRPCPTHWPPRVSHVWWR